jgi:two-component system, CAI-1 autoinducer sensor kinase/phosphatase CqsS
MVRRFLRNLVLAPVTRLQSIGRRLFTDAHWEESQSNRLASMGWVSQIGFPLYYWIWAYVFPQPYESLALRIVGMIVTLPFFFTRRLRSTRWFDAYFFLAITYSGPFFFTYMFLMNGGSSVWAQSLLIPIMVLFHFELKVAVLSFTTGTALAYFGYVVAVGHYDWPHPEALHNIPVVIFAILSASIVKIGRNILVEEQLKGMASVLGTISHELRTPLRSVDASARGLKRYLPALVEFYEQHHQAADADPVLSSRVAMMGAALDRIQADVQYMNSAIDLLLANAGDARKRAQSDQDFNVSEVIREAVRRYPFENAQQRALVNIELDASFTVKGNSELFMMVVFNLLKNALRAVAKAGKGNIRILTGCAKEGHYMIFRDTGCGIPAAELPYIFRRLYSYPANMGTGIGLAFCRDTLEALGATIGCSSEQGLYTEFVIRFPSARKAPAM